LCHCLQAHASEAGITRVNLPSCMSVAPSTGVGFDEGQVPHGHAMPHVFKLVAAIRSAARSLPHAMRPTGQLQQPQQPIYARGPVTRPPSLWEHVLPFGSLPLPCGSISCHLAHSPFPAAAYLAIRLTPPSLREHILPLAHSPFPVEAYLAIRLTPSSLPQCPARRLTLHATETCQAAYPPHCRPAPIATPRAFLPAL